MSVNENNFDFDKLNEEKGESFRELNKDEKLELSTLLDKVVNDNEQEESFNESEISEAMETVDEIFDITEPSKENVKKGKKTSCRKCGCIIEQEDERFFFRKEFNEHGQPTDDLFICKKCHDLNLHYENEKNTKPEETREYKITASKEQLNSIECLLGMMTSYGKIGHSGSIKIYVDGDGAFRPKIERLGDSVLCDHLDGYAEFIKTPYDTYGTREPVDIDLG